MKSISQISLLLAIALVGADFTWAQNSSLLHVGVQEVAPAPPPQQRRPLTSPKSPSPQEPSPQNSPRSQPMVAPPERIITGPPAPGTRGFSPPERPDHRSAAGLRGVSWTYQPAPPLRQFHIQDIVTIRVDEITRMQAEGETEKRRDSIFSAILTDWLRFSRFGFVPDPQEDGDPAIASKAKSHFRAEASVESRESLTFNVAARIVDIRPNGNLVLEARKKFRHNDNLWETSLSGTCRAQDIAPDNVVLSKDLIDLEIHKEDRGQLVDGYQRGWFQKTLDRIKPF